MLNNNRIESLDSLRGLASLSVVIHHILLATPLFFLTHEHHKVDEWIVNLFSKSPLHMIWAGHEAVMLFFVLSGFVLALPFLSSRNSTYPKYLTKRFCRIYIPYIVSIGLSIFLFSLINPSNVDGMSANFNNQWGHEVSFFSLISYVLLLGFDTFNINGVTWSLVHEMRISIFFPFLMLFIAKFNWKKSLLYGISTSLMLWSALMIAAFITDIGSIKFLLISFADTFYYTSFFIIGATLAKYREIIITYTKQLSIKVKSAAFILFVLLYNLEWISFGFGDLKFNESFVVSKLVTIIIDFSIAGSVVILFSLVLSSTRLNILLNKKSLINLGKISYSLYLVHIIVLLTTVHLLHNALPISLLLCLVLVISVLAAIPFYMFVEKPSMQLGKYLTRPKQSVKKQDVEEIKVKRA